MQLFNTIINNQEINISIVENKGRCFDTLVLRSGTTEVNALVFEGDARLINTLEECLEFIVNSAINLIKHVTKNSPYETKMIVQLEKDILLCETLLLKS